MRYEVFFDLLDFISFGFLLYTSIQCRSIGSIFYLVFWAFFIFIINLLLFYKLSVFTIHDQYNSNPVYSIFLVFEAVSVQIVKIFLHLDY